MHRQLKEFQDLLPLNGYVYHSGHPNSCCPISKVYPTLFLGSTEQSTRSGFAVDLFYCQK